MATTVPIVLLEETGQAKDIKASKGPTDIFNGRGRIKEYVKVCDIADPMMNPRLLEFDQPYQVAAHATGCTWEEGNLVFLEQIADCNLDCDYCFANNPDAPTVEVTPAEYMDDFYDCRADRLGRGLSPPRVCRISGGEPFLHQEWLDELFQEWLHDCGYLWIDTNITISPTEAVLLGLSIVPASICGCFKPDMVPLGKQLGIVEEFVAGETSLFLYWPCDQLRHVEMSECLEQLEDIQHGLPLRLTPIHIEWDYSVVAAGSEPRLDRKQSQHVCDEMRKTWWAWCDAHYTTAELWQPSHLA